MASQHTGTGVLDITGGGEEDDVLVGSEFDKVARRIGRVGMVVG